MATQTLLSIGAVASRSGVAVSAIRYYTDRGLLPYQRGSGGQRLFARSELRRVAFILIAQKLGFSLAQISEALDSLPQQRSPTKADWKKLSSRFRADIDTRIAALQQLRESLSGCIGCGCLSLQSCTLYNPNDRANRGGHGPRYLLGDTPEHVDSD